MSNIRNKRPVCPKCGSEDVFDVTKNMGKLL
jgi:ribosomal protein S27AE